MTYCSRCRAALAPDARFCPSCGEPRGQETMSRDYPPPPGHAPIVTEDDPWFAHALRCIGVAALVAIAFYVIAGFFWMAHIFDRTAHRKRDLLWLLVPVAGAAVQTRAIWRYTAREVYWQPLEDRPPDLLRGWQRPWAIGAGWVLFPLMTVLIGLGAAAGFDEEWTPEEREDLIQGYHQEGFDRATAECIADEFIEEIPDPDGFYTVDEIDDATTDAVNLCSRSVD